MEPKKNLIVDKTFDFAVKITLLYDKLRKEHEYNLSSQLFKSATSIGANVEEAQAAQSKKDFLSKMSIASKEARETRYWLRILDKTKFLKTDLKPYLNEIEDIVNIITKIVKTSSGT